MVALCLIHDVQETRLWASMIQLSALDESDVPFGDELAVRAGEGYLKLLEEVFMLA